MRVNAAKITALIVIFFMAGFTFGVNARLTLIKPAALACGIDELGRLMHVKEGKLLRGCDDILTHREEENDS